VIRHIAIWAAIGSAFAAQLSALAQIWTPPVDPNQREVYLVRKDSPTVPTAACPMSIRRSSGNVWLTRQHDGNTSVKVAITATPNTTYHFFLKCVRHLTDITTDEEAVASVAGPSRPAWSGRALRSKCIQRAHGLETSFQSAQVKFQKSSPGPLVPRWVPSNRRMSHCRSARSPWRTA
jgi:hypothetical protein